MKSSTYLHSDGKTLLRDENGSVSIFADFSQFSLKFVGEIWQCPTKTTQNVVSEGQWLVSMTGLVFGQKFTRYVKLNYLLSIYYYAEHSFYIECANLETSAPA